MPIKVTCACGQSFSAKDHLAGKTVRCPKCQQPLTVSQGSPAPAGGLADLLDEGGVVGASMHGQQPCPGCKAPMTPGTVICVQCGYNLKVGQKMEMMTNVDFSSPDAKPMSDAEKALAKAEKEIKDSPIEQSSSQYGDGWEAYIVMAGMVVALAVFLSVSGVVLYLVNEQVQETKESGKGGNPGAMVSIFFGLVLANVGGIWLLVLAFMEDIAKGVMCLLVPLYILYFAATQFGSNKLPVMMYFMGIAMQFVGGFMMGLGGDGAPG